MKHFFTLFILTCSSLFIKAQDLYLVKLKAKENTSNYINDPVKMLSQRALDRRTKYAIALDDKDVPISATRINQIKNLDLNYIGQTKWLNTIMVEISDQTVIQALKNIAFVESVTSMVRNSSSKIQTKSKNKWITLNSKTSDYTYSYSNDFIQQINLVPIHKQNILGQNVLIAVIDGGFTNTNTLTVFNSLRSENRILDTYDFVENKQFVYTGSSHGTMVLSTMAGETNGSYVGTAPKANYSLYRSENDPVETPKEMLYWIQAAERADSIGADVINTSLGYSEFDDARYDYTYQDMDGKTTLIAQGAEIGASRGIFLVNAAGNEGNVLWKMISSPADAKNVFSVGANDLNKIAAEFTSYGPNSVGDLKPNVSALGKVIAVANTSDNLVYSNGTSFASPVTAGAVALMIQQFPKTAHQLIKDKIQQSAHLYQSPSTQLGYGIPDYYKASVDLLSTNDLENKLSIKIFPNPFHDIINVQSDEEIKRIELYNLVGQNVGVSVNKNSILTNHLSKGIYVIKVIDSQGNIFSEKVIK